MVRFRLVAFHTNKPDKQSYRGYAVLTADDPYSPPIVSVCTGDVSSEEEMIDRLERLISEKLGMTMGEVRRALKASAESGEPAVLEAIFRAAR